VVNPRLRVAPRWRVVYAGAVAVVLIYLLSRDMRLLRSAFVYDVFIYQCYARGFWQGEVEALRAAPETKDCRPFWGGAARRYHTLPREYPAPALAVFSLPLLTPWLPYNAAFEWWMAMLLLSANVALALRGPPGSAVALPLYTLLAGWQFLLIRYDLAPGLCILLALILAEHERPRAATVALAVSTLLKGFALLLVPVFVLTWRRRYRSWRLDCLLLGAGLLLLGLLPVLIASPEGALEPLRYAAQRPLHVESLAGMLLWTTSSWIPGGARLVFSYGSNNVVGPLEGIYSTLFAGLFVVGLGAGYRLARRRDGLVEGVLLLLIVTLVTNKVFSPQYILWALPTVAYYEGLRLRWLVVVTLVFFISGDGVLPFAAGQLPTPPGGEPFPSPSFVGRVLACHAFLCWLGVSYALRSRTPLARRSPA